MMNLDWYNTLIKPKFTPPSQIFAPVWGVMYTLIFISIIIILSTKTEVNKTKAVSAFLVQLILNFSWSPIFFLLYNIELSFIIIILLLIAIITTITLFFRISKIAAILLVPYLLWTSFAAYLNYSIMVLN